MITIHDEALTMKASVWTKYGPPVVMELQEVERPVPRDDEVLVRVHAASINSWDWELTQGSSHNIFGRRKRPPCRILGCDISGTVEEVGGDVTLFEPGDEVFGDLSGSGFRGFAEYVRVKDKVLARKSASMTHEEAAATPQAALLALQGLRKGGIREGQRVLINGAGGGVGTFAIQIAKARGTEVTGVDRGDKADTMLSLGADHVVDYVKEDFTRREEAYDLILDVTSRRSVFEYKPALVPGGVCIILGGKVSKILGSILLGSWVLGSRKVKLGILHRRPRDLDHMKELYEAGKVKPVIDRTYPLGEVGEAFRYFGRGDVKGKIVIRVKD
jgi:NADPH:quinone reductase-like Zn-dependent oxidoreductase